ncbi:DUF3450 family protein [Ferrimonas lipolytica]|uniref:DUF3450 domain-containing protein n=1 Tax=Ferrimonas lipolytica TaxID=2724191 RepID=A0A6H1UHT9_9GAMM|nr:DUF3450 family protein [Ferrimonas lipolytica]QIZ78675.1 DUF3450 domain-containing protein [Ferrimonas lipolytica]
MLLPLLFSAAVAQATPATMQQQIQQPLATSVALGQQAQLWQQQKAQQQSEQQQALAELYWTEFQISKLQRQVEQQQQQINQLNTDIANIDAIRQQLEPSLEIWYAAIENQINADMPFLQQERQRRLQFFRQSLDNADMSHAERFRRLLELVKIEVELGYGSHTTNEVIVVAGEQRQVQTFRLGRLAWFAQSHDGQFNAHFNTQLKQWQPLSTDAADAIQSAIAISQNQQAAKLITLPFAKVSQ